MVSRLDIINKTLEYLERGDINGAIEYLRLAREIVLKEMESRARRPRVDPIIRCKQLLEGSSTTKEKIMERAESAVAQTEH